MANLKTSEKNDLILYGFNTTVGTDKADMEKKRTMAEHYDPMKTDNKLASMVINPSEILSELMGKLTPTEIFVLNEYLGK